MTEVIFRNVLVVIIIMSWSVNGSGKFCVSNLSFQYTVSIYYITAVITVAPSSVNTTLHTLVNFTCQGTGSKLLWTVEGNSVTDTIKQNREISVTTNNISVDLLSSVLTIRALPINDGIIVGCTVIGQNFDIVSKGAILIVQGYFL